MNYLLDTHTFMWLDSDDTKLSAVAKGVISDKQSVLWVSLTSIWEIQIKIHIGKLTLRDSLTQVIQDQQARNRLQILPITLPHILDMANLPDLHRDPFDRLLISQARVEGYTLLTRDSRFMNYPVQVLW